MIEIITWRLEDNWNFRNALRGYGVPEYGVHEYKVQI